MFNGIEALTDLRYSRGNRMIGGKSFVFSEIFVIALIAVNMPL